MFENFIINWILLFYDISSDQDPDTSYLPISVDDICECFIETAKDTHKGQNYDKKMAGHIW